MIYFVGDRPILLASFETTSDSVDPTAVNFFVTKIEPPGATVHYTAPDVIRTSLGEYKLLLPLLTSADIGIWKFVATGTGAAEAGSNDGRFEVKPTVVVPRT